MTEPMLPKPAADLGDTIVDVILDLIDEEPDDLKAALYNAIRQGAYEVERHAGDPNVPTDAGHQLVRFPALAREYVVPLVRVGPRRFDA